MKQDEIGQWEIGSFSFTQRFISFSAATLIVFFITSSYFGSHIVFGNILYSTTQALFITAFAVGLVVSLVEVIFPTYALPTWGWHLIYWVVNSACIYILARTPISAFTAIGISRFWVAIILGLIVNFSQYIMIHILRPQKLEL